MASLKLDARLAKEEARRREQDAKREVAALQALVAAAQKRFAQAQVRTPWQESGKGPDPHAVEGEQIGPWFALPR